MPWSRVLVVLVVALSVCAHGSHGRAETPLDFARDIAPLFEQRCVRCHRTENAKGEFSLASREEFLRGGESGAVVVAGKPDESLLIAMVSGKEPAMPAEGAPLTKAEVARLRGWIAAGAAWPRELRLEERSAGGRDWWAFQAVSTPALPRVRQNAWPRNAIDHFVLAALEEKQLSPSPEADRRTLLRRLSFDLLGLPPTPEQVAAFESDRDPRAYENLVDRMLASPHHGERWARHWLDIAHYADTHGFERDLRRDNAWPYRDYVIQALNADQRYNDFLREQLAGDVIRPTDPAAVIATGFLVAGPWDYVGQVETSSPSLKRAARADDLDDMLTQVMTAACGMTINCARCHDHKLDPISQREYYQLAAVFAGVQRGERDVDPQLAQQRVNLTAERDRLRTALQRWKGAPIDLADIVAGGDGRGTGTAGGGIDPLSGKPQLARRGFLGGVKPNVFAASSLKFVDGVVVPDASEEGTIISSTGVRLRGIPKTSAQAWDAIRSGPVNSQFSTKLGDTDFATAPHSLLALHANGAITFDLAELRSGGAPQEMRFTASVGYFGQTPRAGASVAVAIDGKIAFERGAIGREDGLIAVSIALPADARFLTLLATDNGNGISHDQVGFGDPHLVAAAPRELSAADRDKQQQLERQLQQCQQQLQALPAAQRVYAVVSTTPPATHVLHRGDAESPRDEVSPGALECLAGLSGKLAEAASEAERRRALAEWIVHPDHPLTRRVIVNRLWHYHFGVGLVDTPSDFGFGGGRPTHPELLDWLSQEFARRNWSLKQMHRLICTSATYRQESRADRAPERDVDSANRLLWRMHPRRLDAESVRDSVLAVSGKLNRQMYGPGYRDFKYTEAYAPVYDYVVADQPDLWRRTIYRFVVRTTAQQFLTTLDCPNPANLAPVRNTTTTALQSLALLNNEFMLRQAGHFAERIEREAGQETQAQVRRAFAVAFARAPSDAEADAAQALLESHGLRQLCRMLLNANEFVYVD